MKNSNYINESQYKRVKKIDSIISDIDEALRCMERPLINSFGLTMVFCKTFEKNLGALSKDCVFKDLWTSCPSLHKKLFEVALPLLKSERNDLILERDKIIRED